MVENIPGPLLDRMEVVRLVGYITAEKTHIARGYLEKAAREGAGVMVDQVLFTASCTLDHFKPRSST